MAPQIAAFIISEKPANWGDTVTATCTMIKGDQPVDIEWSLNGVPITQEHSDTSIVTTKRVSLLTIDVVKASHAGEYTCSASNAAGGTSYSAPLIVNGINRKLIPGNVCLQLFDYLNLSTFLLRKILKFLYSFLYLF